MCKLTNEEIERIETALFVNELVNRIAKVIVKGKKKKMKIAYEATIKFQVVHEVDTLEDIKDNNEFANDLAHMVCDEASTCGAVASYEIIESKLDAKESNDEIETNAVYKDFMKNSSR